MYVYKETEHWNDGNGTHVLYTVGFYANGNWNAESDHDSVESAAARVHYLNGGDKEE